MPLLLYHEIHRIPQNTDILGNNYYMWGIWTEGGAPPRICGNTSLKILNGISTHTYIQILIAEGLEATTAL